MERTMVEISTIVVVCLFDEIYDFIPISKAT